MMGIYISAKIKHHCSRKVCCLHSYHENKKICQYCQVPNSQYSLLTLPLAITSEDFHMHVHIYSGARYCIVVMYVKGTVYWREQSFFESCYTVTQSRDRRSYPKQQSHASWDIPVPFEKGNLSYRRERRALDPLQSQSYFDGYIDSQPTIRRVTFYACPKNRAVSPAQLAENRFRETHGKLCGYGVSAVVFNFMLSPPWPFRTKENKVESLSDTWCVQPRCGKAKALFPAPVMHVFN